MKSDIICKHSRYDARRAGLGASRQASLTIKPSPTLAPDSTTQPTTYEYN
ncbi:hypothetical protein BS17DRAFT_822157 [Gyrodon lividus]|nr:hypothetical protein BS17DRAFT_822157 [Gyrodon lividus]